MQAANNKRQNPTHSPPAHLSQNTARDFDITYTPRPDASWDSELHVLAAVYSFVLRCHEQKVAAEGAEDENITEGGHVGESPEECTAREGSA